MQATLRNNSIYYAFHATGATDPNNDDRPTAQSCYVVINVAKASVKPATEYIGFPGSGLPQPARVLTGAYIEAHGCLNVTTLGPRISAFYPAMTVDSVGHSGIFFMTPCIFCYISVRLS